jgi:hypothetical protein
MLVATMGVNNRIADDVDFAKHVSSALSKFRSKDWGDSPDEDKKANDWADTNTGVIRAAYGSDEDKIWIIREADNSATTILFPSEY